jgi:four helix bundle protein
MGSINSFKDLEVWEKSVLFVTDIYQMTQNFPKEEIYGLTSQIRRAAVSIPSNISEGWARKSTKTYIQFLHISRGSLAEVQTQLVIAENLNYTDTKTTTIISEKADEIGKMLNGLINSLESNLKTTLTPIA